MQVLSTTGFLHVKALSACKGAHGADANRAVEQRQMPETRLNMPKLPPRQWFSSVHPATAVANGKSQTMENPTRSQTRLNLRLVSGECMAAPIRGDYCPGLIEAQHRLPMRSKARLMSYSYLSQKLVSAS